MKKGVQAANEALTLSDEDAKKYEYANVNNFPDYKPPTYFSQHISLQAVSPENKPQWYDYTTVDRDTISFWVDFANYKLGGGVFGDGSAEEEEMCWETPDLGNAAAAPQEIFTRSPHAGVLQGSPTPVVIRDVHRVMSTMIWKRRLSTISRMLCMVLTHRRRSMSWPSPPLTCSME